MERACNVLSNDETAYRDFKYFKSYLVMKKTHRDCVLKSSRRKATSHRQHSAHWPFCGARDEYALPGERALMREWLYFVHISSSRRKAVNNTKITLDY